MIHLEPVIDFHSHILPEMDDGSASVEMSIAMLKMQAEQGITHVVATPHFYPSRDDPMRFLTRRNRSEEKLRREMAKHTDLPQVLMGAEVYYFCGMSLSESLPLLTIGEKKCIMVEMPHCVWDESIYRELWQIRSNLGLTPIVAHIDRYIRPIRTRRIPERLGQLPVMVQANAEFFLQKQTAGMAVRMAKAEQIHLLGSDCHDLSSRKPNLGSALQVLHSRAGDQVIQHIHNCGHNLLEL